MYYLVCLLMTPGVKISYYIAVQLIDNSENKKIKGILAVLASYIIELGLFGLKAGFNSYKMSLIIEMILVYLAVLVILWIKKYNRCGLAPTLFFSCEPKPSVASLLPLFRFCELFSKSII